MDKTAKAVNNNQYFWRNVTTAPPVYYARKEGVFLAKKAEKRKVGSMGCKKPVYIPVLS